MTFGAMAAWQAWLLVAARRGGRGGLFLSSCARRACSCRRCCSGSRVLDESRELTLWERIRRAVSLVVTVIVALALGLRARASVAPRRRRRRRGGTAAC